MISLFLLILFLLLLTVYGLHRYTVYRRQVDTIAGPPVGSLLLGNLGLFIKPPRMHIRQFLVSKFSFFAASNEKGPLISHR